MTPFERQLAAYEQYMQLAEPAAAPSISNIITKYYRSRVGFSGMGDASDVTEASVSAPSISDLTSSGQWLNLDDGSSTATSTAAAADTSNILSQFVNTAASTFNNVTQAQQKTAQLQAAAAAQAAGASAAASTSSTGLLVFGAILVVAVIAVAGSK